MTPSPRARDLCALLDGASVLGYPLGRTEAGAMLDHLDGVYQWNAFAGLTNVPRSEAIRLHVLDSLSIAEYLPSQGRVVDLGTGAGFPGIPLAISRPDLGFDLVEARARRCSFLLEMVRLLGLSDRVRVLEADAHALRGELVADVVVSRAFLPPLELIQLACELLSPAGRLILMRGGDSAACDSLPEEAATRAGFAMVSQREFVLPGGTDARRVTVLDRIPR